MSDMRAHVVWLLRLRCAWRADHLATLAAVPLPRARAYVTQLAAVGAVRSDADGSISPGRYARRWIALENRTRPGGNSAEYRRQREVRDELLAADFKAKRAGVPDPLEALLTSNDVQEGPSVTTMTHPRAAASNDVQTTIRVPPALSLDDAAIALNCSRNTVRARVHDGTLRAVRLGRLVRIPQSEVDRVNAGQAREA